VSRRRPRQTARARALARARARTRARVDALRQRWRTYHVVGGQLPDRHPTTGRPRAAGPGGKTRKPRTSRTKGPKKIMATPQQQAPAVGPARAGMNALLPEARMIVRGAIGAGSWAPDSAEEVHWQLVSLAHATASMSVHVLEYLDTLIGMGLDRRVGDPATNAAMQLGDVAADLSTAYRRFAALYAGDLEQSRTAARPMTYPKAA
jgi:hypothetical protein